MNSPVTTVFVLLCCLLLVSYPVGFVTPASAASAESDLPFDFCGNPDHFSYLSHGEMNAAGEEAMNQLPRWYQDVARGNDIVVHVYDNPVDTEPRMSFFTPVGADFEVKMVVEDEGGFEGFPASLTVETDCQTLNQIISSDDMREEIVDAIWEGDITYYGNGPGADAAVVYSNNLLSGAYMLEHRQMGSGGDFFLGALAPVTKTHGELLGLAERIFRDTGGVPESRRGGN